MGIIFASNIIMCLAFSPSLLSRYMLYSQAAPTEIVGTYAWLIRYPHVWITAPIRSLLFRHQYASRVSQGIGGLYYPVRGARAIFR